MNTIEDNQSGEIRSRVRERYGKVARDGANREAATQAAIASGYEEEQLSAVPEGARMGLGCGNPTSIDTLKRGEVVVDLGCGGGMDAFIASRKVGPTGRVIGIDMTEDMIGRARANAARGGYSNVEFRLGLIEQLPLPDGSADAIISNCVINLSPDKGRTFGEAYRVLKPGGRLMVSDLVIDRPFDPKVLPAVREYMECGSRASLYEDYLRLVGEAGFRNLKVVKNRQLGDSVSLSDPTVVEAMEKYNGTAEDVRSVLDNIRSISMIAWK